MTIKTEKKQAFTVVGMKVRTRIGETMNDCPMVWEKMMPLFRKIPERIPGYGISYECRGENCEEFTYMGAMPFNGTIPEGCEKLEVPAATYAIFEHKGKADSIGQTYEKAIAEMKKKGLEFDMSKMNIEYYPPTFENKDDSLCEIWMPVKE